MVDGTLVYVAWVGGAGVLVLVVLFAVLDVVLGGTPGIVMGVVVDIGAI